MSRPIPRTLRALTVPIVCSVGLVTCLIAPAMAARTTSTVALRVEPVAVKKGGTARLTAIVKPTGSCTDRAVLFEIKAGRGWDKLGTKVEVDKGCRVSRKVKIERKSVFRVLLIDQRRSATLVTSPSLTVKLR